MKKIISLLAAAVIFMTIITVPAFADNPPLVLQAEMNGCNLIVSVVTTEQVDLESIQISGRPSIKEGSEETEDFSLFNVGSDQFDTINYDPNNPATTYRFQKSDGFISAAAGTVLFYFEYSFTATFSETPTEYALSMALLSAVKPREDIFSVGGEYDWHNDTVTGTATLARENYVPVELQADVSGSVLTLSIVAKEDFRFTQMTFQNPAVNESIFTLTGSAPMTALTLNQGQYGADNSLGTNANPFYINQGDVLIAYTYTIGDYEYGVAYHFTADVTSLGYLDPNSGSAVDYLGAATEIETEYTFIDNTRPAFDAVNPVDIQTRTGAGTTDSLEANQIRYLFTIVLNSTKVAVGDSNYGPADAIWAISDMSVTITRTNSTPDPITHSYPCPLFFSVDNTTFQYSVLIKNLNSQRANYEFTVFATVNFKQINDETVTGNIVSDPTDPASLNSLSTVD